MAEEAIADNNQPTNTESRTFLGGMRLNSRIVLFFAVGILSLAAMGGIIFNAQQRLNMALDSLTSSYHVANLISNVQTTLFALNSDSQTFLFTKSVNLAETYSERSGEAAGLLNSLKYLPKASNSKKILSNLIEGITKHATHFQNTVRIQSLMGTRQSNGLVEKADLSGSTLQKLIIESRNTKLIKEINLLRKMETRLQELISQEDAQAIMNAVNNIRRSVVASRLGGSVKRLINNGIDPYAADLEVLAQTRLVQVKEIALMEEINTYLGLNLKDLVMFSRNLSKQARKTFSSKQIKIRDFMVSGIGIILILFTIFGIIVIRSIVRPIKRIASAAIELAGGNESVKIPAIENQDETGEVAVALSRFRENMIEANLLRKELEDHLRVINNGHDTNNQINPVPETIVNAIEKEIVADSKLDPPSSTRLDSDKSEIAKASQAKAQDESSMIEEDLQTRKLTSEKTNISGETLQSQPISEASLLVAQTSLSASNAAKDAERCDLMITGLSDALKKTNDIELLLASISDHMSLLAVQTAITNENVSDNPDKEQLQTEKSLVNENGQKVGNFFSENLDTLQNGTKRAIRAVRQVGETINDVNAVALEIAAEASNEALDAATTLLQQSENLRGMLDGLLGKIKPGAVNQNDS